MWRSYPIYGEVAAVGRLQQHPWDGCQTEKTDPTAGLIELTVRLSLGWAGRRIRARLRAETPGEIWVSTLRVLKRLSPASA